MTPEEIGLTVLSLLGEARLCFAAEVAMDVIHEAEYERLYYKSPSWIAEAKRHIEGYAGKNAMVDEALRLIIQHENKTLPRPKPAPRRKNKPGYIYLLHSEDGSYKIGKAKDPTNRASVIGTQIAYPITIIHTIKVDDMPSAESKLHERFADKRLVGEWFALNADDVDYIQSLTEL